MAGMAGGMEKLEENPLLQEGPFPCYDAVEPKHVCPGITALLQQLENDLAELERTVQPTWPGLVKPLEKIVDRLSVVWGVVNHLKSVKDSEDLRSAVEEVQPEKMKFQLRLGQSKPIFNAFKAIQEGPIWETLNEAQKQIVQVREEAEGNGWKAEKAIAGNQKALQGLRELLLWPLIYSREATILGLRWPKGLLLYGPPGTGKTSLIFAIVRECGAHLSLIRDGREEENSSGNGAAVGERLLSTLLTEIDGLEITKGVLVLGATNRPEAIDAALMRPGRFDLVLYVPPPDLEGRIEVLRVHTRNMKLENNVDLPQIAKQTQFFTGAELAGLCREAAIIALRENIYADTVCSRHFELARNSLRPSLTEMQIASYSSFMKHRRKTLLNVLT